MIRQRMLVVMVSALLVPANSPAKAPKPLQEAYFTQPPAEALSVIANRCMDRRLTVVTSTPTQVHCMSTVSGFKGALTQLMIGNSYSTTPTVNVRFQAIAVPGGSRVQFSQWVETQMAFGQVRRAEVNDRKTIYDTLASLYSIGGSDRLPIALGIAPTELQSAPVAPVAGIIDTGIVQLIPAETPSGYCIMAPENYAATGSKAAPIITKDRPRCAQP